MGAAALQIEDESIALAGLNREQRIAAESTDRPTLVISPAGTGKTRVLAARYLMLLEMGVPTNRILAITFSRRAAGEMRERIGPVLHSVDERDIYIDTFHTLGSRILKSMPEMFGLKKGFRIIDEDESQQLMRQAARTVDPESVEHPHFAKERVDRLLELLDDIKSEAITPSSVATNGYRFGNRRFTPTDIEILEEYEHKMGQDNCVDFNDLILKPILAFRRNPKTARAWARQFESVMVDEYQDTNKSQYELLRFLTDAKDNVLLLGDDDQLIFAWRGADNSYVVDFEKHWTNGRVITLETNYRNAPEVLSRAKGLIDRNLSRRPKEMNPARENKKASVELRTFDNQNDEQDYITKLVAHQIESGKSPDDIAVLTRYRKEATNIALALGTAGIKCFYPDSDIFRFREVRALVAWSRVAIDETDRLALMVAMETPNVGLQPFAIDQFSNRSRESDQFLADTLREAVASGRAQQGGPLMQFMDKLEAVKRVNLNSNQAFQDIAQAVGLEDAANAASPTAYAALFNAYEIFSASFEDSGSVHGVLEAIKISAQSGFEAHDSKKRVRVDTMHAAKGLEFDTVIVSGWEEGTFPQKIHNDAQLEEERRLAYVTLTRARDHFIATVCRNRPRGSKQPSRFLSEIGLSGDLHF